MNKLFVSLFAASAAVCSLCAAEPVKVENTPAPAQNPAGAGAYDGMKAYEDWSLFQFSVIPQWPPSAYNANVYGLKTGWPAYGGIGRVFGAEISWGMAGTSTIKGLQVSWTYCQNHEMNGIQASFLVCLNFVQFKGLQASCLYSQAGDFYGIQASTVNLSKNATGLQAALGVNVTDSVSGFQAAPVNVVSGPMNGMQCGVYSQVKECNGVQLGVVNVSESKGLQFGLVNYIKDAWLPVFPIVNFKF